MRKYLFKMKLHIDRVATVSSAEGNGSAPVPLPGKSQGDRSLVGSVHGSVKSGTPEWPDAYTHIIAPIQTCF